MDAARDASHANDKPSPDRHPADGGTSTRVEAWHAFVGFGVRRLSLAVACLACATVAGGIGCLVAPLVGQPTDAGFWGGATTAVSPIVNSSVVCAIGYERGWRRFRRMERVYANVSRSRRPGVSNGRVAGSRLCEGEANALVSVGRAKGHP